MGKIVIVDFESGNLFSVFHACKLVGLDPLISSKPEDLSEAHGVILPGVGAFGDAMKQLSHSGMDAALKLYINKGLPFFGICLGMQLLFDESEEFGSYKGLGLVKGVIRRFNFVDATVKVPHVGWNQLHQPAGKTWSDTVLKRVSDNDYMYFVHSYFTEPEDVMDVLATSQYGGKDFCAAVLKNNIFATQFHPEKSGKTGMSILKEFAALILK